MLQLYHQSHQQQQPRIISKTRADLTNGLIYLKQQKNNDKKIGKYPGQILQVSGQLASSVSTAYDDNSATIGSNLAYAAIHQLGGQAGKNKKMTIPARPYLKLTDDNFEEILTEPEKFLK